MLLHTAIIDCLNSECPIGSECRVCDTTGLPYCEYSCTIDNGGCGQQLGVQKWPYHHVVLKIVNQLK